MTNQNSPVLANAEFQVCFSQNGDVTMSQCCCSMNKLVHPPLGSSALLRPPRPSIARGCRGVFCSAFLVLFCPWNGLKRQETGLTQIGDYVLTDTLEIHTCSILKVGFVAKWISSWQVAETHKILEAERISSRFVDIARLAIIYLLSQKMGTAADHKHSAAWETSSIPHRKCVCVCQTLFQRATNSNN